MLWIYYMHNMHTYIAVLHVRKMQYIIIVCYFLLDVKNQKFDNTLCEQESEEAVIS